MNTQKAIRNTAIGSILAVVAVSAIAITNDADGSTGADTTNDIYKGTGWQINSGAGVYSIDRNQTYVVTYDSTTARTKLQPTLEKATAQLRGIGIKIFNTTAIETVATTSCPPRNHIVMGVKYRPAGSTKKGISLGQTCFNSANHSLASGKVWMDSEYTQLGGTYKLTDRQWKNGVVHEFGHALGLAHAPTAKNSAGDTPVLTAPNGGYVTSSKYGTFTNWDVAGIKQMIANFDV